ncbi:DnaB-like helicase C-terminal domain-containing protein [Nonomuraea sp. NPDC048881]|uniref:replicative DNA helicase n=1 Tax=Nonomuraea sp. NPDC048881 TaxID=3155030 RepID=UPI0033E10697
MTEAAERPDEGEDLPAYPPLADAVVDTLDLLEAIGASGNRWHHVPTGFEDLDMLLGGLRPGHLVVVASRPSIGSTTLLLDFCRAATRQKQGAYLVSYELPQEEITMRLLSSEARVSLHRLRSGLLSDDDWTRLAAAMERVAGVPLHLSTPSAWTMAELQENVRKVHGDHTVELVVVDGLQYVRPDVPGDTREREVTQIGYELKALARELRLPVVVSAQLNRLVEQRLDKRPNVHTDLRDSDAIAHIADTVILLHREDAYERESPRAGEMDLIVAKNRQGPIGTVTLAAQFHYARLVEFARE